MLSIRAQLAEWSATIEPDLVRDAYRPVAWLIGAALTAGLLAAGALAPGARDYFALELGPVLVLGLLTVAVSWVVCAVDLRRSLTPVARGLGLLAIGVSFQLFGSGIVAFSAPPGSFVLASIPLAVWWLHALLLAPTLRTPLPLAAHALGTLCAVALNPHRTQSLLLLASLPLGAGGALAIGSLVRGGRERRRGLADHRATIEAQVLAAQAREKERVGASLSALAARLAEARTLVAAAWARNEDLGRRCEEPGAAPRRREGLALTGRLRATLARLAVSVEGAGLGREAQAPGAGARLEAVDAGAVTRAAAEQAARLFPAVAVSATARPGPTGEPAPRVLVRGGEESLRTILDHLVSNACEGDGLRGACAVEVAVAPGREPATVDVVVTDDGPGLRPELLAAPVQPFVSTKADGTGLGLYTASALAAASGGELVRENLAGGGARLTVRLRAAARVGPEEAP